MSRLGLSAESIKVIRRHSANPVQKRELLRAQIRQEMDRKITGLLIILAMRAKLLTWHLVAELKFTHTVVTTRPLLVTKEDMAYQRRLIADASFIMDQ